MSTIKKLGIGKTMLNFFDFLRNKVEEKADRK